MTQAQQQRAEADRLGREADELDPDTGRRDDAQHDGTQHDDAQHDGTQRDAVRPVLDPRRGEVRS